MNGGKQFFASFVTTFAVFATLFSVAHANQWGWLSSAAALLGMGLVGALITRRRFIAAGIIVGMVLAYAVARATIAPALNALDR